MNSSELGKSAGDDGSSSGAGSRATAPPASGAAAPKSKRASRVAGLFLKALGNAAMKNSAETGTPAPDNETPSSAASGALSSFARRKKRMSSLKDAANAIRMAQRATRRSDAKRDRGASKSNIASIVSTIQARQEGKKRTCQYYTGKFLRRVWRTVRGTVIGMRDQNAVSEFMSRLNSIKQRLDDKAKAVSPTKQATGTSFRANGDGAGTSAAAGTGVGARAQPSPAGAIDGPTNTSSNLGMSALTYGSAGSASAKQGAGTAAASQDAPKSILRKGGKRASTQHADSPSQTRDTRFNASGLMTSPDHSRTGHRGGAGQPGMSASAMKPTSASKVDAMFSPEAVNSTARDDSDPYANLRAKSARKRASDGGVAAGRRRRSSAVRHDLLSAGHAGDADSGSTGGAAAASGSLEKVGAGSSRQRRASAIARLSSTGGRQRRGSIARRSRRPSQVEQLIGRLFAGGAAADNGAAGDDADALDTEQEAWRGIQKRTMEKRKKQKQRERQAERRRLSEVKLDPEVERRLKTMELALNAHKEHTRMTWLGRDRAEQARSRQMRQSLGGPTDQSVPGQRLGTLDDEHSTNSQLAMRLNTGGFGSSGQVPGGVGGARGGRDSRGKVRGQRRPPKERRQSLNDQVLLMDVMPPKRPIPALGLLAPKDNQLPSVRTPLGSAGARGGRGRGGQDLHRHPKGSVTTRVANAQGGSKGSLFGFDSDVVDEVIGMDDLHAGSRHSNASKGRSSKSGEGRRSGSGSREHSGTQRGSGSKGSFSQAGSVAPDSGSMREGMIPSSHMEGAALDAWQDVREGEARRQRRSSKGSAVRSRRSSKNSQRSSASKHSAKLPTLEEAMQSFPYRSAAGRITRAPSQSSSIFGKVSGPHTDIGVAPARTRQVSAPPA